MSFRAPAGRVRKVADESGLHAGPDGKAGELSPQAVNGADSLPPRTITGRRSGITAKLRRARSGRTAIPGIGPVLPGERPSVKGLGVPGRWTGCAAKVSTACPDGRRRWRSPASARPAHPLDSRPLARWPVPGEEITRIYEGPPAPEVVPVCRYMSDFWPDRGGAADRSAGSMETDIPSTAERVSGDARGHRGAGDP